MVKKELSGKFGDYVIRKEFEELWQVGWSQGRCSGLLVCGLGSRLEYPASISRKIKGTSARRVRLKCLG